MKCRDQLHELVKEEIEKRDSSTEEWKIAMERSFNRMDNEVIARNDSKQSFRRNVVSLAVEHKEVRSRLASHVQSLALQTLTRQAEAKAKKMEDEMYRLQESLEERNCSFKHQHLLLGSKGWLIDRIEYMRISGGPWSTIGALRVHRNQARRIEKSGRRRHYIIELRFTFQRKRRRRRRKRRRRRTNKSM
ncbi:unnamed protein product [Camellia sinensis]